MPTFLPIRFCFLSFTNGRLLGADPQTTLNRAAAQASVAKRIPLAIEAVVAYHGGLFRDRRERIRQRLTELAQGIE